VRAVKLDTLHRLFARQARVKLFVVADGFCLCGYASNPRVTEGGMLVDIGASVRLAFGSRELIAEPVASGTLLLDDRCRVTRRIQTHRRHLEGRGVSEEYVARALGL
jgi:hypothetical protein